MKTIKISCTGANTIDFNTLIEYQGNLKELTVTNLLKLKNTILSLGFSEPISVWKHANGLMILNGHQRLRALDEFQKEGYQIPAIPINYIEANDESEAKRKILSLTSQFGTITDDGLLEFITENQINIKELENFEFKEIDIDKFIESNSDIFEPATENEQGKLDQLELEYMKCPHCNKEFEKRQATIVTKD